jgi:HD superfamily phosphohydrolase
MRPTHTIYDSDAVKTFTIPVSGAVRLYGPEIDVVNSREFQRLAGIRQLGTANLVYRGANHTRYEHSLGTLHRAEQLLQATATNPR